MIQSINFMGREEYLTKPAKKIANKTQEYVGDSSIIKNTTEKAIDTTKLNAERELAEINLAYRAAHAPYLDKPQLAKESPVVMDGQILM